MKPIKLFLCLVILIFSGNIGKSENQITDSSHNFNCQVIPNSCVFYENCVEANFPCGPSGYAINFVEKFCTKSFEAKWKFSSKGKLWVTSTIACLQETLLPVIEGQTNVTTCDELTTYAFNSHPGCYTQKGNSICFLPPTDWMEILIIIKSAILDNGTIQNIFITMQGCGLQYSQAFWNELKSFL